LDEYEQKLLIEEDPIIVSGLLKAWSIGFTIWAEYYSNGNIILNEWNNVFSIIQYIKSDNEETAVAAFTALAIFYTELETPISAVIETKRTDILNIGINLLNYISPELNQNLKEALDVIKGEAVAEYKLYMSFNRKVYYVNWAKLMRFEYIKSFLKEGFYVSFERIFKLFVGKTKNTLVRKFKIENYSKWRYINPKDITSIDRDRHAAKKHRDRKLRDRHINRLDTKQIARNFTRNLL